MGALGVSSFEELVLDSSIRASSVSALVDGAVIAVSGWLVVSEETLALSVVDVSVPPKPHLKVLTFLTGVGLVEAANTEVTPPSAGCVVEASFSESVVAAETLSSPPHVHV